MSDKKPRSGITSIFIHASKIISNLLDDGKQKSSIAVLDGVRGFACFIVVFFHLNLLARDYGIWHPIHELGGPAGAIALAGQSGVMLFFILSGFLLFLPYAKALLFDTKWPSLRSFYLRRAFRVMPAYYVALFLIIIFSEHKYLHRVHWNELWLFLTFRMDFPQTYQQLNGPFWTMAIEVQFYLLLPLIAWLMGTVVRRGSLRRRLITLTGCIFAVIAWGLLTRYWGLYLADTPKLDFLLPHTISDALKPYLYGSSGKYFEVFATGMLICMIYVYSQNAPESSQFNIRIRKASPIIFLLGIGILLFMAFWHFYMWYFNYTMHFFDRYQDILVNSWNEWEAISFAIGYGLFMFSLLYAPSFLKRPWEWTPLRWIGLSSYSLYIWHFPLMLYFVQHPLKSLQANGIHRSQMYILFWIWTCVVAGGVSLYSYLHVEKPWIRVGRKLENMLIKKQPKREVVAISNIMVAETEVPQQKSLADARPIEEASTV